MSNPVKGEVYFEARGQTYTFKIGTNAQVLIEEKIEMSMAQWMKDKAESQNLSTKDIRLIMWAGLFRNHQMNEDDVGDLIDEIGPERAAEIFTQAATAAAAKSNGVDPSRPQKQAKERIGMHS